MTSTAPWVDLPTDLAEVIEPQLPLTAEEILAAIRVEVPEYARPLEGAFGEAVRSGVTRALERFLALIRGGEVGDPLLRDTYIALGRAELRAGRTLDALQSAYRVGARVAWRRFAAASAGAFPPAVIFRLAEAIFAYIDELSAESVEGYARAQSELAGERDRLRQQLVQALLRGAPDHESIALADRTGWTRPRTAAALACRAEHARAFAARLGPQVLAAVIHGVGCLVVPDAEAPGKGEELDAAARTKPAALGPQLPLERLGDSWRLAVATRELDTACDGLVCADEHLRELLLIEGATVIERIRQKRLASLDALTPNARARAILTALAHIQHRGNAAAMARALNVHPQTARYRIKGLRDLLATQLDDPDARLELEAALLACQRARPRNQHTV